MYLAPHARPVQPHRLARSLRNALAGAALAALAWGSHAATTGPGALDPIFGADGGQDGTPNGVVGLSLGAGHERAEAVAVQKDGKIVVVGSSSSTGKTRNIVIQRLNPNGSLDKSFGADRSQDGTPDGVVSIDMGDSSEEARAVVIQPDGKIVIAGNSTAASSNLIVARLHPNGSLDKSFGADGGQDGTPDGVTAVSLGDGDEFANDLALDKTGHIVIVGTSTSTGKSSNIAVARLKPNGSLDTRFGADGGQDGTPDGVVSLDLGDSSDEGRAVAIQPDGKIVIAGNSKAASSNLIVARLNPNGSLDKSFGVDGGQDGTPDGVTAVSLGDGDEFAHDLALDKTGHIVIVGTSTSTGKSSNIAIARLKPNGRLDARFGADGAKDGTPDGVVSLDLGDSSDEGRAVAIQPDGKIVIAGNSKAASSNLVVARLRANGSLDKSFGADAGQDGTPDGVVQISLGQGDDVAKAIALQTNGKIILVGDLVNGASIDAFVARILGR